MSIKLYAPQGNFRANMVLVAGALAGLKVELVHTDYSETKTPEFLKKNPLGKVPVIETAEGFVFETNAILRHFARTSGKLYGGNAHESALVDQFLDMAQCEFLPPLMKIVLPILGYIPSDKEVSKLAKNELHNTLKVYDERLKTAKFLAGEQLTVADVQLCSLLTLLFRLASSEEQRKSIKNVVDYYTRVAAVPEFAKFWGRAHFTAAEWEAPACTKDKKKECKGEKKEAPKKEAPKKEAPKKEAPKKVEAEEEEVPAGEQKWNLYDWKTLYTNAKDKTDAIKNLQENFKEGELCLYHIHYQKYEGEGLVVYTFNNLKNGFIQRCEPARKKAFGTYSIYGEEPNLEISGVWLFVGADIPAEMKENPQFEYLDLKKLDINKPEDLALIKAYWTNTVDDESVVEGLRLRSFATFK